MVCNCNNVSFLDIVNELHKHNDINNLLKAFEDIKDITRCSTGCGGCYDKVMAILSDAMND
ncbi:MAG TPA: (2Fe-2S)-binding protein [Clostridia bacterium]|nr:(2Fe-2S)-binding protein [Clostridia bacterium]